MANKVVRNVQYEKNILKPEGFNLTQAQMNEIQALFGGSLIKSGEELVEKLKRSQTIRFTDEISVPLTTDELWTLKQQSIGMGREFQLYAKEFVEDALSLQLNGCTVSRRY